MLMNGLLLWFVYGGCMMWLCSMFGMCMLCMNVSWLVVFVGRLMCGDVWLMIWY